MNNSDSSGSEMDAKEEGGMFSDEENETKKENNIEENKEPQQKVESIDDLKKNIAEYQDQMKEINELIAAKGNESSEELTEMKALKKQIQDAIEYTSDLIKLKDSNQGKIKISMRTLTEKDKGKVCEAFFESEQQWFAGTISNVNLETQTAEIDWIGFTDKTTVPAKYIKIAKHPDQSQLQEGFF